MTDAPFTGALAGATTPPSILVVDDDRRVLELLEVALTANGYRVITAADGDEGVRRALGERPDLVVLDVRLPRKSGLEVCEVLRSDAEDPFVPIILVSGVVEAETRLQAFRRGADDYLSKPFSPKELIARIRRLLTRSAEGAAARKRARELDHEIARLRDELRRAHGEVQRAERLRDAAYGLGSELHRSPDPDDLTRRFLAAVQAKAGLGAVALLLPAPDEPQGAFEIAAIGGPGAEDFRALRLEAGSELLTLVAGLGRPVLRRELERLPELRDQVGPLGAAGIALLAPLRAPSGLQGVLAAGECPGGEEPAAAELELLRGLCELAAVALQSAARHREQLDSTLELIAAREVGGAERELDLEARSLAVRAARACRLPAREPGLLAHALAIGRARRADEGRAALARVAASDRSGRAATLERILTGAATLAFDAEDRPDERRASLVVAVALDYRAARERDGDPRRALATAFARAGEALDPATARGFEQAIAERDAAGARADPSPTSS